MLRGDFNEPVLLLVRIIEVLCIAGGASEQSNRFRDIVLVTRVLIGVLELSETRRGVLDILGCSSAYDKLLHELL